MDNRGVPTYGETDVSHPHVGPARRGCRRPRARRRKWAWLKTDVTTTFVAFTPARTGTYPLRARLRDKALKKSSGFSPASTLRVS